MVPLDPSLPFAVVATIPLVEGAIVKLSVPPVLRVIAPNEAVSEVAEFLVRMTNALPALIVVPLKLSVSVAEKPSKLSMPPLSTSGELFVTPLAFEAVNCSWRMPAFTDVLPV